MQPRSLKGFGGEGKNEPVSGKGDDGRLQSGARYEPISFSAKASLSIISCSPISCLTVGCTFRTNSLMVSEHFTAFCARRSWDRAPYITSWPSAHSGVQGCAVRENWSLVQNGSAFREWAFLSGLLLFQSSAKNCKRPAYDQRMDLVSFIEPLAAAEMTDRDLTRGAERTP